MSLRIFLCDPQSEQESRRGDAKAYSYHEVMKLKQTQQIDLS